MEIPRYWKQIVEKATFSQSKSLHLTIWGHSNHSYEEAGKNAKSRLERVKNLLNSDSKAEEDFYYPVSGVIHEDILETINSDDKQKNLVTRNHYFSQVLNTSHMMFVDMDVPLKELKKKTFWNKLLGKSKEIDEFNKKETKNQFAKAFRKIESFVDQHPEFSFRVYRTYAGYRLIATHKLISPTSDEAKNIFMSLGADKLYSKLCQIQKCFRARLTPKFWRLPDKFKDKPGIRFCLKPGMFESMTPEQEAQVTYYKEWIKQYEKSHTSHATCRYIKTLGSTKILDQLKPLIQHHDKVTQAESRKPLA